jgi:hypothetical protein
MVEMRSLTSAPRGLSCALLLAFVVATGIASADEPVGTWRHRKADRPVKVIVLGGSIGAWPTGSFAHYVEAICSRVELRNISKVAYGAPQLRQRFRAQVLKNPGARVRDGEEHWLLSSGGLNSIGSPSITIKETIETFLMARKAGMKVLAFTLTPWGDDKDRRWRNFDGLDYKSKTQRSADFLLGRLGRAEALESYAGSDAAAPWTPEELPDVAIDLYDSPLRNPEAPLRDVEKLGKLWDRDRKLQKRFPNRDAAIAAAAELPRWFLRPELRSFDHVHPNQAGHKLMAQVVCPKLPTSWGCDCAAIDRLAWVKGALVPQ